VDALNRSRIIVFSSGLENDLAAAAIRRALRDAFPEVAATNETSTVSGAAMLRAAIDVAKNDAPRPSSRLRASGDSEGPM